LADDSPHLIWRLDERAKKWPPITFAETDFAFFTEIFDRDVVAKSIWFVAIEKKNHWFS